jgi:hypothetical protein
MNPIPPLAPNPQTNSEPKAKLTTLSDLECNYLELYQPSLLTALPEYQIFLAEAWKHYNGFLKEAGSNIYPYQPEYAALYCCRRKNLCCGAPGVGKTIISALTIAIIYGSTLGTLRPGTIQILAPSWLSAASRWLVDLNKIPCLVGQVEVIRSQKDALSSTKPIWIYSMDFLKRRAQGVTKKKSRPFISRWLVSSGLQANYLIVDEVHNFKPGTKRTHHLNYYRHRAKRILALTGTPSDGRLALIHRCCSLVYGSAWPYHGYPTKSFAKVFEVRRQVDSTYATGLEVTDDNVEIVAPPRYLAQLSAAKLADYYELIRRFIHRIKLDDPNVAGVCKTPTAQMIVERIKPTRLQKRLYNRILNRRLSDINTLATYGQDKVELIALMQPLIRAASAPWLEEPFVYTSKFRCLEKILTSADAKNEKVVVFSGIVGATNKISHYLRLIYGEEKVVRIYATDPDYHPRTMSPIAREEALNQFLFDPKVKFAVISLRLGCESIDLTSATYLVFWDYPWQSIILQQAIRRVVRPGSVSNEVNVYLLTHEGMIDEHQLNLALRKIQGTSLLVDFDASNITQSELGTLDPVTVAKLLTEV